MFQNDVELEDTIKEVDSEYHLSFELSERQKKISSSLKQLVNEGNSVLLEAVCGAGKTELVYETIADCLNQGKKVGFAIARRQVVLEIGERLQSVFTKLKVVSVCQGYTRITNGDVVVCTSHQLYRYHKFFDLLIIDEPDAFPFKGNPVLQGFANMAVKGSRVYLTATPDEGLLRQVYEGKLKYLYLPKRPTGRDMIVPEAFYGSHITCYVYGLYRLLKLTKKRKQVILFVPTIEQGKRIYLFLRGIVSCCYINSLIKDKDAVIREFKEGKFLVCLSTTVLERGITIKRVNCIVLDANHSVFDEASLVQMAGRVGRDVNHPEGECLFLATKRARTIDDCIKRIERANYDR